MPDVSASGRLAEVLAAIRAKVSKYRGDRSFNEQNTKASLIVPLLHALGWDTNDPDEVNWEFKPKPKYNPVDFALLLQRTPCLLLEAKALRDKLDDDKLVAQILAYAGVAGVQWVVLTNGDEYRIYNASAPIPVEQKLFRTVTVSSGDPGSLESTLALLSKQNLQDKKIGRLWESQFVDRQVRTAMEEILDPSEPSKVLIRAIGKHVGGALKDSQITASLRRARVMVDFPEESEAIALPTPQPSRKARNPRLAGTRAARSQSAIVKSEISVEALIREGLLKTPAQIVSQYRGRTFSASVEDDGTVMFKGEKFASLSVAGGRVRDPFYKGKKRGKYPATNGWTFWQVIDPVSKKPIAIDVLRDRFLEQQKTQANRFVTGG
jgi:predicted type IV restriction endonuclease